MAETVPELVPPVVDPVPVVTAIVQSAWWSKINWTAAATGGAMLLVWVSGGALHFTPDQISAVVTTIGVIGSIVTWIFRTFFTKTLTPTSVKLASAVAPVTVLAK